MATPEDTEGGGIKLHQSAKEFYPDQAVDTLLVDGARAFALAGGVARFTLTQEMFEPDMSPEPFNAPVVRIAMPLPSLLALSRWLNTVVDELKTKGVLNERTPS